MPDRRHNQFGNAAGRDAPPGGLKGGRAELEGTVEAVIFRNPESGFSVAALVDKQGKRHTFCGVFPYLDRGQPAKLSGVWENNDYGLRLKVDSYDFPLPVTREGLERYLGSGLIRGLGPKTAKNIVDYFGDKTLEILNEHPGRLREIEKIGVKTCDRIIAGWRAASGNRGEYIFFESIGLTPAFAKRLVDRYGSEAAAQVRANPYRLADDLHGVGFLKADKIASDLGLPPLAPQRLLAGVVHTVNELTSQGNSCYPEPELVAEAEKLLHCGEAHVRSALAAAVNSRQLVISDGMVYPAKLFKAENELPVHLLRLLGAKEVPARKLAAAGGGGEVRLNERQLAAVNGAAKSPVSVITGGPGVGKTTVLGELVRRAKAAGLTVQLCAPTGRAAKRLAEATGHAASTIHRLLGVEPVGGGFVHNNLNPLKADLIVVDESSMLDLPLALALAQAVKTGCAVVFVGDADQLPPVGPGTVLASLIDCGRFPVTRLTEVFRQGAGSLIVENAHRVNAGLMPLKPQPGEPSDFYWVETEDPERAMRIISKLLLERIPQKFGLDPKTEVQLLSPMVKGVFGTANLNAFMQNLLNGKTKQQFRRNADTLIKLGDKVMQTANDYDKGVFNGDMGVVTAVDWSDNSFEVTFDGASRPTRYSMDEADRIVPAYAVTVHKSQGGEFPAVILPLSRRHYMMLQRNLLYTAMTRARKVLVLISEPRTVGMAVRNVSTQPRYGGLTAKLAEKIPPED